MTQPKEDSILPEVTTTEVPPITPQENELNTNSSQVLSVEVLYDRNRGNNRTAPIQPVKPIVGLTLEEQLKKKKILT